MSGGLVLSALDGSNPLAFLAALGTFRLLNLSHPDAGIRMKWERMAGFWRPVLTGPEWDRGEVCDRLMEASWAPIEDFEAIGKNLTVPKDKFLPFIKKAYNDAKQDSRAADFAASFGSEVCDDPDKGRIEYTDLCFITGSGHQDFLGTMGVLRKLVTAEHLSDALFGEWRVSKGYSMRWDPSDAAEYALQWDDPGPKGAWAVWGANRLAIEALPLFPAMPAGAKLKTTGFSRRDRQTEFTWPIWTQAIGFDTTRSLMSLKQLQDAQPERDSLSAMGVGEVFRAQRVRIGQGANFKVSFRMARAV